MIPRVHVSPSAKKLSQPAAVEVEVISVLMALNDDASETTGMSVRVKKFDVAYCRQEDVLLIVNQIINSVNGTRQYM